MKKQIFNKPHQDFVQFLLSGNHLKCSAFARRSLLNKIPVKTLYEEIIREALYEVGELWETNRISVASEHLASAIVEAVLNELYGQIISHEKINKTVIVACVENEFHQIGIKMVSDVFEMNGWNTHFLGANTPTDELISFAKTVQPDMLAISLSIYFHIPVLLAMLDKVRAEFPRMPVLVGGQAFRHGGQEVLNAYERVTYLPDLDQTELYINQSMNHG